MSTWAIRDIKHGKTFHFDSWYEMLCFVNANNRAESDYLNKCLEEYHNKKEKSWTV